MFPASYELNFIYCVNHSLNETLSLLHQALVEFNNLTNTFVGQSGL